MLTAISVLQQQWPDMVDDLRQVCGQPNAHAQGQRCKLF